MSEQNARPRRPRHADEGMTLVEILIVLSVLGVVVVVVAAAVIVTMRSAPVARDRATVARWEQNLGTWLPGDLASATWPVDTPEDPDSPDDPAQAVDNPDYEPCATAMCTWGENIAHLSWFEDADAVDVSYRYGQNVDGTYEFRRVECRNGSCEQIVLVRDMPAPSSGGEPPISVTFPPDILSTDPNGSPVVNTSGRRVSVTVRGLDGVDLLSFTGGGTELVDLQPAAIQPPQFLQARSGCGGPITLIVDESGSLTNSDAAKVRTGVKSFIETFAGTPTQLQIIGFNRTARVLGAGSNWNHWYDLSEQSTVNTLLGSSSPVDNLGNNSATNWEDAIYRATYTQTGQTYQALGNPANPPAELIVFFTDGMPTYHRDEDQTGAETPEIPDAELPSHFNANNTTTATYTQFDPKAWYRASWLLQQNATRVIGVGVGTAFGMSANLDRDTTLSDTVIANDWLAPYGPADGQNQPRALPAEVALGDLIAGNDISNYAGDTTGRYVKVSYNGGWDPEAVGSADLLTTTDFSQFGGALESIALAECGGTLTVQTRNASSGSPVSGSVTYEITGDSVPLTESTTSAVSKTAVFDISTEGSSDVEVLLRPRSLDVAGYTAVGWECRLRNVVVNDPAKVSQVSGDPSEGLELSISTNEALSCILLVQPS